MGTRRSMGNRRELLNARRAVDLAQRTLTAIEALPRRRGALVIWINGVVWERIGDDRWQPLHSTTHYEPDLENYGLFDSAHVATSAGNFNPVTQIKQLPNLEGSA